MRSGSDLHVLPFMWMQTTCTALYLGRNKNDAQKMPKKGRWMCAWIQIWNGSCVFLTQRAASQRSDIGKVCDGSCRSNFLRLGHLIISGAEFPLLPLGTTLSLSALVYPLCLSLQCPALRSTTHHTLPPFTFCSLLVLQDLFWSPLCQETAEAWLMSSWGVVLLFNTKIRISPLSCIHIFIFQGVSLIAVGSIFYWRNREFSLLVELCLESVSQLIKWNTSEKIIFPVKGRKSPLSRELQSMAASQLGIYLITGLQALFSLECTDSVQIKIHY